jgi:hypothetical protein
MISPPGDNFTPRGQNSPLGSKFAPRGEVKNGPLDTSFGMEIIKWVCLTVSADARHPD